MTMTAQADTVTKQKQTSALKEPGMFKVVFYNDNVTPMDFVVQVLVELFRHNTERANSIMQQIHNNGSGVAGVFTYEIAEQKGLETSVLARENGYPLQIKIDPA
jgi:ATP-dependent Clp protease adaptor protein ClpS